MEIKSPLPGRIVKLCVNQGDTVESGQLLAILEAMKMEYQLRSPLCGVTAQIFTGVGRHVSPEDVLLIVE